MGRHAKDERKLADGAQPLSPQNYLAQTLAALWDNLPQVTVGAVWLSLWAAPAALLALLGLAAPAAIAGVLLTAPAWVALQHFEVQLLQGKSTPLFTLWTAFSRYWGSSVRLGALALFLPVLTALLVRQLPPADGPGTLPVVVATLGALGSVFVAALLVLYAAPLLVLCDQAPAAAIRNSPLLAARHIANTLGLLALVVLGALATVYLSLGLLFVLPAFFGVFVINNCRLVVELETQT